jgi:hypothetical protein
VGNERISMRFNENLDLGTSALAERPINRDAFADLGDELSGDDF